MDKRKHNIERYLKGEMTPAERHALEKEALEDPFLSEALEGFQNASPETYLFDLRQLHHSVHQRTKARKPTIISMWNWSLGIAAGLIFIAVSAVFIIGNIGDQKNQNLAQNKKPDKPVPQRDTSAIVGEESTPVAGNTEESSPATRRQRADTAPAGDDQAPTRLANPSEITKPVETELEREHLTAATQPDTTLLSSEVSGLAEVDRDVVPAPESAGNMQEFLSADTTYQLRGRVTSADDKTPLPGVNVTVSGTSVATQTDSNGYYELNMPDLNKTLAFNFIGMQEVAVKPGEKKVINVELAPDLTQLSEVVVIGYDDNTAKPITAERELAEPQGGKKAFEDYLEKELRYPEQALENGVEGRVTIEFTVGTDGNLAEFQVLKGLGYGCDDEAIRLVREGPAWKPSRRNAQPITEKVKLRLKFSIPKKK